MFYVNLKILQQPRIPFKSFFEAQFNCCCLIWMFYSRSTNNKINKCHERALRIVYDDYNSKFEDLYTKDDSFTIHQQYIQTLEIKMSKTHHEFSQVSFLDLCYMKTKKLTKVVEITMKMTFMVYNLNLTFKIPRTNSTLKEAKSARYLGRVTWNNILTEMRSIKNFDTFKIEITK